MGIFNKVGREVERLKQNVTAVAEKQSDYQCLACDAQLHTEYDECPECGAQEVTSRTTTE